MTYSKGIDKEYSGTITGFISHEDRYGVEIVLANFITEDNESFILNVIPTLPDSEYSADYNNIKEVLKHLSKKIKIKVLEDTKFTQRMDKFGSDLKINFLTGMLLTPPTPILQLPESEQLKIKKLKEEYDEYARIMLEQDKEDVASWFEMFNDYAQTDDEIDILK